MSPLCIRLLLLYLFISGTAFSQNQHYHFKAAKDMLWGSHQLFVYAVPKDSVEKYVLHGKALNPEANWLQQPLFSLPPHQFDSLVKSDALPAGYYIGITAKENAVQIQYKQKAGLQAALIQLHNKNFIEVKNAHGEISNDVIVSYNGKSLPFDAQLRAFPIDFKRKGNVVISKGNDVLFFNAYSRKDNNGGFFRGPTKNRNYYNNNNNNFKGYLVSNKPNYLPLDTVKYKAYLLNANTDEPIVEPIDVYLQQSYKQTFIHSITSQGDGLYFSEFVLGDTILPDQNYKILLKGRNSGTKIEQNFKVEDYLLDDSYLRVSTEGLSNYQKGDSIHLYAYAYNVNGLPLIDARIEIILMPGDTKLKPNNPSTFIADTLLHSNLDVAMEGDTHIGIDTKDFPDLDEMNLMAKVILRNVNNEIKDTVINLKYTTQKTFFKISEEGNMIRAHLIRNKKEISGKGYYTLNGVFQDSISYPFQKSTNYTDINYAFYTTDEKGMVMSHSNYNISPDKINIQENYVKDTASFYISNSQNIGVRYALFQGNKLVKTGYFDTDTLIKAPSKNGQTFTLITNYNWQNKSHHKSSKAFKLSHKMLVDLDKSDIVFPGQKDSVHIRLHDLDNKGIRNTNVTVFAFNAKFKDDFVPHFASSGDIKQGLQKLKRYNYFNRKFNYSSYSNGTLNAKWEEILGLDTNFFYQNIYKDTSEFVVYSFNTADTQYAQVAMYIKEGKNYVQPELIYAKNELIYINDVAIGTNPNALLLNEGKQNIVVRTPKFKYNIHNLVLKNGIKTNVFINGDSIPLKGDNSRETYITKTKESDSLNHFERNKIDQSLFYYKSEQEEPFVVKQGHNIFASNNKASNYNWFSNTKKTNDKKVMAIGPIQAKDSIHFFQQGNTKTTLLVEQNFSYTLRGNMVRMIQEAQPMHSRIRNRVGYRTTSPEFNLVYKKPVDFDTLKIMTEPDYFKDPNYEKIYTIRDLGGPIYITPQGNVSLTLPDSQTVKSVFFIPVDKKIKSKVYDGLFSQTATFIINSGRYKIYALWSDTTITSIDDIEIKAKGKNIINLDTERKPIDYNNLPKEIQDAIYVINDKENILLNLATKRINGSVRDERNEPLAGATIVIKDSNTGVIADENGYFSIDVPISINAIEVAYFGLQNRSINLDDRAMYYIQLFLSSESVAYEGVTVYGKKIERRTYTGSISSVSSRDIGNRPINSVGAALDGAAPGLVVTTGGGQPGSNPDIMLRGQASLSASSAPLIILDGAPYSGSLSSINPDDIETMEQLKDATCKAVYGARAANGVILIETKAGSAKGKVSSNKNFLQSNQAQNFIADFMENMQAASGMRTDFRDWAIWEPNLWTDKNGKVSFEAQYPGTATSWKTYVLAMNPKGFSLSSMYVTKSFKPLSAAIAQPRFLRYGDSVELTGNVLNYTNTAFDVKTIFKSGEQHVVSDFSSVKTGKTEKLIVAAPQNNQIDTTELTNSFALETKTGYTDGEEKTIPIIPVGLIERKGIFTNLKNDTSFNSSPNMEEGHFTGNASITVDGSLMDVMMQEIENLKEYPHGCTEQVTSKLLSIHYEEEIKKLTGSKDFNNTKTKRQIINKLAAAQNKNGSFGWFSNNDGDVRVTNYVLNALTKINTAGLLNNSISQGYAFLKSNLENMPIDDKVASLSTLSAAKQKLEYDYHLAYLDTSKLDIYNKFSVLKIKKEQGFDYKADIDSLIKNATVNENGMRWGEESYDWYRNQLATTLLAYQIIKDDTAYAPIRNQIIDYLLFKRKKGNYQNTAESGLVLSNLLPELIAEAKKSGKKNIKSTVSISGTHNEVVHTFPKIIKVKNNNPQFQIKKEGIAPTYVSVSYEFFNPEPKEKEGCFQVSSTFKSNSDTLYTALQHGEQIKLIIKVEATKDAEYVLIDVPIPAGCIPLKTSKTNGYEASRANFKDKTSIYCNALRKGIHYFEIDLQARFKGSFNLSPASASMMYYPDEQGNTAVKKIQIK